MENITEILKTHDYDFLRDNPMFGSNIMMLAVSGSRSYGTATDTSDLDIRGVSFDLADDMLMLAKSRNISHKHTDTHIFQFNSFLDLLTKGQPNTIELFGLKDEHYLYRNDVWKMLEDKKEIFLSQHILHRVKGYADSEFGKYKNIEDEKNGIKVRCILFVFMHLELKLHKETSLPIEKRNMIFLWTFVMENSMIQHMMHLQMNGRANFLMQKLIRFYQMIQM